MEGQSQDRMKAITGRIVEDAEGLDMRCGRNGSIMRR